MEEADKKNDLILTVNRFTREEKYGEAINYLYEIIDSGIDRDPSYIYGPVSPRTIYFGIKTGNELTKGVQSGYQRQKTNRIRHQWRGNRPQRN